MVQHHLRHRRRPLPRRLLIHPRIPATAGVHHSRFSAVARARMSRNPRFVAFHPRQVQQVGGRVTYRARFYGGARSGFRRAPGHGLARHISRSTGLAAGAFCPRTWLLRCSERDHGAGPRRGSRCENCTNCQKTFAVHVARSQMLGYRTCRPGQTPSCSSGRPVRNVKFGNTDMHSKRFLTNPGTFVTQSIVNAFESGYAASLGARLPATDAVRT